MKRALIVTYNKFPDGDAGAVRQLVFAKMINTLGYSVDVIGMGNSANGQTISDIMYTSFRNEKIGIISKFDNYFGFNRKLKKYLNNHQKYDLLFVVDLPWAAMKRLEKYSVRAGSTLVHDSVEWYSKEEFRLGVFSPEYLRKDIKNKYLFNHNWKIVAISSYLNDYFLKKGNKSIRIPVVLDAEEFSFNKHKSTEKTVILYAGAPGGKDCFDQILIALENLEQDKKDRLEFRIIGVTSEWLRKSMKISEERWKRLSSCVNCLGRKPREVVLENLNSADFTILIRRPELRYAKAGFSTKVPESLSTGTPVICNISSDLGMYLLDGENAIIAENNSDEAIASAINKALSYDCEKMHYMQKIALKTAIDSFDYRKYLEDLKNLIDS